MGSVNLATSVRTLISSLGLAAFVSAAVMAQSQKPDWKTFDEETMQHFQSLLRFDTMDPPGNEKPAADYLMQVLEREGIPTKIFALELNRQNVVDGLKGNDKKRTWFVMGHTDSENVDQKKWTCPPSSATRDGGYVYGRGAVDDKDNVTGALMTALTLKRLNIPLDRDVIFLFEAGEEGASRLGIRFMVDEHFD